MDMINEGQKVILHGIAWGTVINNHGHQAIGHVDTEGTITSIQGITPSHTNVHKYEITYDGGRFYTDKESNFTVL